MTWKRQAGSRDPSAGRHPLETQAKAAKAALEAWIDHSCTEEVVDLITDLLHLADKWGHEYTAQEIITSAYEQYAREINGEEGS